MKGPYVNSFDFVGGGVDLRDDDVLVVLELLAQLVPNGRQFLAMTAPGGVKFDEYVLGVVLGHLVEVVPDQNLQNNEM